MSHVCFYGSDKVGDQVIPLLEDDTDTAPALLDPVLLRNKAVIGEYCPQNDYEQYHDNAYNGYSHISHGFRHTIQPV